MARRKQPSKRRIKARFRIGQRVPEYLIANHRLYGWVWLNNPSFSDIDRTVQKIFRGSNG